MKREPVVVGIVAEKGAGKGLCADILGDLLGNGRATVLRFSDPLKMILEILGKEVSRENFQILALALREAFHDEGVLVPAMEKLMTRAEADLVILDGIRKPEEVSLVRKFGGILLSIAADQRVRFERRREGNEKSDEQKMSWEQFVRQDRASTEIDIRRIGETMADETIENNGTEEEFRRKVREFFESRVAPLLRDR